MALVVVTVFVTCSAFSLFGGPKPVYAFGVSGSFTDTVLYYTDIQILDSAVLYNGLLVYRDVYSLQLKSFLEDNKLQRNSTTMIFFSKKRKKLEKTALKVLNKYKKNTTLIIHKIGEDKFRFTVPEEEE